MTKNHPIKGRQVTRETIHISGGEIVHATIHTKPAPPLPEGNEVMRTGGGFHGPHHPWLRPEDVTTLSGLRYARQQIQHPESNS